MKTLINLLSVILTVILFSQCEKDELNSDPDPYDPDPNDIVNIPDTAFLYALINEGVDANNDSLISYSEAEAITTLILEITDAHNCFYNISDMTGIEAFINLDTLNCNGNPDIMELDLSKNTKLEYLNCCINGLMELNITKNTMLKHLDCSGVKPYCMCGCFWSPPLGNIKTLDLTHNTSLECLRCSYQKLMSLDITNNTALVELYCDGNQLTSLDISKHTNLKSLNCSWNQLTYLDVSGNTNLISLGCDRNDITSLDITNNIALTWLSCGQNDLTTLDVSNNMLLEELWIDYMPSLNKVCVWITPFPPNEVEVYIAGSPNVYFTTDCSKKD